ATEVADPGGGRWPVTWPAELPAGEWRPPLPPGGGVAGPRVIAGPPREGGAGRRGGAPAGGIGGGGGGRARARGGGPVRAAAGGPFGCVHAVSDEVTARLSPRLAHLFSGGRVSPWRVGAALLRAPRLAGELWRLARHTRRAARRLGQALGELLTLTLPGGA